jgi:hypothetical protein
LNGRIYDDKILAKIMNHKSDRLTREQVDQLLEDLKEPLKAREFLMDAGLIDENGQLTEPYRPAP